MKNLFITHTRAYLIRQNKAIYLPLPSPSPFSCKRKFVCLRVGLTMASDSTALSYAMPCVMHYLDYGVNRSITDTIIQLLLQ